MQHALARKCDALESAMQASLGILSEILLPLTLYKAPTCQNMPRIVRFLAVNPCDGRCLHIFSLVTRTSGAVIPKLLTCKRCARAWRARAPPTPWQ